MMRFPWPYALSVAASITIVAFLLSLTGCSSSQPTQDDYMPEIAVAIGLSSVQKTDAPITPSDECGNCGGTGVLGDGTIEMPCGECGGDGILSVAECDDGICIRAPEEKTTEAEADVAEDFILPTDETANDELPAIVEPIESVEPPSSDVPPASVDKPKWIRQTTIPKQGLVVVHYMFDGCKPCERMEENVLSADSAKEALRAFDSCIEWDVRKKSVPGVDFVPAEAIFLDGKRVSFARGFPTASGYTTWLSRHNTKRK